MIKQLMVALNACAVLVLQANIVTHRLLQVRLDFFIRLILFLIVLLATACDPVCLNNGQCQQTGAGNYTCVCTSDYTGNQCETSILGKDFLFESERIEIFISLISNTCMCNNARNSLSKWCNMYNQWS
jgi:hypothetical protein